MRRGVQCQVAGHILCPESMPLCPVPVLLDHSSARSGSPFSVDHIDKNMLLCTHWCTQARIVKSKLCLSVSINLLDVQMLPWSMLQGPPLSNLCTYNNNTLSTSLLL